MSSLKTQQMRAVCVELNERCLNASEAHEKAKSVFARFEGPVTHPMWSTLRDEVDTTLTHMRIMQACWHRAKADLLDQLNIDKE